MRSERVWCGDIGFPMKAHFAFRAVKNDRADNDHRAEEGALGFDESIPEKESSPEGGSEGRVPGKYEGLCIGDVEEVQ